MDEKIDFEKVCGEDGKLKGLTKKLQEKTVEFHEKTRPLQDNIQARKKQLVVENGLGKWSISESDYNLVEEKGTEMKVYENKSDSSEKYVLCTTCKLYVGRDNLIEHPFDDTADMTPGVHGAGTTYICPFCTFGVWEKTDMSLAVD